MIPYVFPDLARSYTPSFLFSYFSHLLQISFIGQLLLYSDLTGRNSPATTINRQREDVSHCSTSPLSSLPFCKKVICQRLRISTSHLLPPRTHVPRHHSPWIQIQIQKLPMQMQESILQPLRDPSLRCAANRSSPNGQGQSSSTKNQYSAFILTLPHFWTN